MNTNNFRNIFIRFCDIFFSFLAIIILFPFMLPIMIGLKLTGEHEIFYRQMRVGRHGKDFGLLKFATMLKNSPAMDGGFCTLKNDPRILPMGRFLRKTKINELPQLINIFFGQMSIVGYRPLVRWSYDQYNQEAKQALFNARPGLSGIGSIVFRNEEEILQNVNDRECFYSDIIMPYKGKLETWFVDNFSILNYFKVIFVTVIIVLKPSTDVWKKIFTNLPEAPEEFKNNFLDGA